MDIASGAGCKCGVACSQDTVKNSETAKALQKQLKSQKNVRDARRIVCGTVECNDLAPDVVYDSLLNVVVVRGALQFLQQMSLHSDMH